MAQSGSPDCNLLTCVVFAVVAVTMAVAVAAVNTANDPVDVVTFVTCSRFLL